MKILTVIGARPQIIKAAALSRAIRNEYHDQITELIVHTGQHYDAAMSETFFGELQIPAPAFNLNTGSGSHGVQTAAMTEGIEKILLQEKPDALIVYGDTNSTLAGALAASKLHMPVVHIEAGLRSYNKEMPEEINRILCDHVSTLLFSPTLAGINNLEKENIRHLPPPYNINRPGVFHCGDVMYDNSLYFSQQAESKKTFLAKNGLRENEFILATIHRNNNTDNPERLHSILRGIAGIAAEKELKVFLPLHPRTRKMRDEIFSKEDISGFEKAGIVFAEPASFLEMILLEKYSRLVVTDSGGVQKEAYFFKKPAVVLREETEWTELVENGNNLLAGADREKIISCGLNLLEKNDFTYPDVFGNGRAAEFICETILKELK